MRWIQPAAAVAFAGLVAVAGNPVRSIAAESAPSVSKRTIASVITDTDRVEPGRPFHLALRLRLAPGWHTYWTNPGDAGIAPTLDLTLPEGSKAGPLEWPVPQRVAEGTLTAYAYTGDVTLPLLVTPGPGNQPIAAHAEWLVCRDVCVPESADFTVDLGPGTPSPSAQAPLIDAALATVPKAAPFSATIAPDGALSLGAGAPADVASAEFFPLASNVVEHASSQVPARDSGKLRLKLDPVAAPTAAGVLLLTSASGHTTAFTIDPTPIAAQPAPSSILPLLIFALAGGLLLNLMPCVFPVLAVKALALARLSDVDRRRVRGEAGSYTAGVILSFTALGGTFLALRSAGAIAGWGFQFQSPGFVTAVAWLLFAIGLSLSGVFSVGHAFMGRGSSLGRRGGHSGSFLTGVLAVVVATPCTAPFMGAAVAGALTLPAAAALTIFAALGMGLALPYGLLALFPRMAALLPRPGSWMRTLQQALAFPMYAAAVWLVWVVSQQLGPQGVLVAGAGLVAVAIAGWALGLAHHASRKGAIVARSAAAIFAASLVALLVIGTGAQASDGVEPFSTARLDQLRGEGRPVFVDMTAAWCLSCLVNEHVALSPQTVRDAFARAHVAYLKGDWTTQNPAISAYLHALGTDGVPLYVLYPPGKTPIMLPQLLTEGKVLSELAKLPS